MNINSKKIVTRTLEMFIDVEGILRQRILEGVDMELADVKESHLAATNLAAGKRMLKLVDARVQFTISKEARVYGANNETPENNIARAVITESLANKIVINFFIKFYKPKSPFKMFSTENDALDWLRTFKS